MKDIIIKGRSVIREFIILLICFIVANGLNVYSILRYGTSWSELYSVWYAVLIVTIVLYVIAIPVRFIVCKTGKLICRKKKK